MFAFYNNVRDKGSLIIFCFLFFLYLCLFVVVVVVFSFFLIFFYLPTTYLSLVVILLLLLLQLCLLILPLWVFLRNEVGESSKQGIQAAWSTPIHHIKLWISHLRGAYRTHAASEVEFFVILAAFGLLYVTENSVLGAVSVLHVSFYHYYCFYYYHYYYY